MSEHKICKNCGVDKALSEYHKNKNRADGHRNECKECIAVYMEQYRRENKEEIKQRKKKYHRENKEKISQYKKKYYRENKEEISQHHKKYRRENKEEIKQRGKKYYRENKEKINQYKKKYYRENKEKIKQRRMEYYRENKEKISQYNKKYLRENKERLNKQHYEREKRRLKTDPMFKLKRQVRKLIWASFDRRGEVKSARSEAILGCKMEDFTAHLKQTWFDKYHTEWVGQPCHIDHIVPLAIAKTEEEVIRLCHYTNLRLLEPNENLTKSAKIEGGLDG